MNTKELIESCMNKHNDLIQQRPMVNRERMNQIADKEKPCKPDCNLELFLKQYKFDKNKKKYSFFYDLTNQTIMKEALSNFYKAHPFLIPFVGKNYGHVWGKDCKILYVMESHYPNIESHFYKNYPKRNQEEQQSWLLKQWYASDWDKSKHLEQIDLNLLWTEKVLEDILLSNSHFTNLFRTMIRPLYRAIKGKEQQNTMTNQELLDMVESIAFMNYYLRPSEETAKQIQPREIDNCMSYLNLIRIWESLEYPKIIFCSKKASNAFQSYVKYSNGIISNDMVCYCNHPSNQSWNRKNCSSDRKQFDFWKRAFTQKGQSSS